MQGRRIIRRAALGAVAAVAVAAPLAAVAAPAGAAAQTGPRDSTASCQAQPGCNEPVVAVAQGGGTAADFTQADDAGLTAQGGTAGAQIYTRINNGRDDGSQDWRVNFVGTVPASGAGDYGFTAFDNAHYAGAPIVEEQWTPFGNGSADLCANIGVRSHLASLQPCDARKGEAYILTRFGTNLLPPASGAYAYILSVRHAADLSRHQLLTADDSGFGRVSVASGVLHSPGAATNQMWSALP
jgi:hypothetical protein